MDTVEDISGSTITNNVQFRSWTSKTEKRRFELLILSEAGKPIYSFTKREDAVTLMPLCSALINYAQKSQKEALQSIRTSDNLIINFSKRPPLIIVVIHDLNSYVDAQLLVEQTEAQVISILTAKTLRSVFEERPTFDLKRLLYGSEKLIDATTKLSAFSIEIKWPWVESFLAVTSSSNVPSSANLLSAANQSSAQKPHRVLIPTVVMPPSTRDNLHNIVSNGVSSHSRNIVFSLLFRVGSTKLNEGERISDEDDESTRSDEDINDESTGSVLNSDSNTYRLITICNHHDRYKLKIADVHMLSALLCGSSAQLKSAESLWMPVCLPKFNQDAFLHSYISYINESKHCLVMMSIDRDEFANCQRARNIIEEKIDAILSDATQRNKIYYRLSPLVHPSLIELQEKLMSDTLTSEELTEIQRKSQIYNSKVELFHARQLQFLWYQTNKQVLWWQRSGSYPPNSIVFYMTKKMLQSSLKHLWLKLDNVIFLGWHVPTFQLYAQFDSTITANEATEVIQRITNWIRKEEDNFSIKDYK